MPQINHVDVRLRSQGQDLQEFVENNIGPTQSASTLDRYVLAEAGKSYEVVVTLKKGYRSKWAPFAYVKIYIDDDQSFYYPMNWSKAELLGRAGILAKDTAKSRDGFRVRNEHGTWKYANFTFGALGLGKTSLLTLLYLLIC